MLYFFRILAAKNLFVLTLFLCLISSCKEKIPEIHISSLDEIVWTSKSPCKVTIIDSDNSEKKINALAKYRGGMSASFAKKSLTVEFEKKIALGLVEKDDDWIFNASYIDKTFLRHKICSDLFLRMHLENRASHSTYVKISIDGIYQGLYLAMEEINASNLGLKKADTLAMLFKDPPIFFEERVSSPQDSLNYYQQKFPKIYIQDKTKYIEEFKNFLFYSSDEEFIASIPSWVDLRNVVDWHLWLLLTNNGDGVMKNFYMYKLDSKTPFRFAVWDCDSTFGRDADNELNFLERQVPIQRSILFTRLLNIKSLNYNALLESRWKELRDDGTFNSGNFQKEIKLNTKMFKPYLSKNTELWPNDGPFYYDDNDFWEEVDLMKKAYQLQLNQLDLRFNY